MVGLQNDKVKPDSFRTIKGKSEIDRELTGF
jgi:hypothetical protein